MAVFKQNGFELENGDRLAVLELAYECYGEMAADRSNVVLVAHGTTSSHIAAGEQTLDRRRGWYEELVGSGKLLDTNRYCVISSNVLGSCYGSTGPSSINPKTGTPYGPSFPEISYADIVRAQHTLLTSLGVGQLMAVVGSSIGGFQAFQWAVTFPDFVKAVIALDTAPKDTFDISASVPGLIETFSNDPSWNGGDYPDGGMIAALTDLRVKTLKSYGFEETLGEMDADKLQSLLFETAREWAAEFDANSLIALTRAMGTFNVENEFVKIKAPLLYVLCDTDEWFPSSLGTDVMAKLTMAGVDAQFHQVHSSMGQYATTEEPDKWVPVAKDFLNRASLG